MRRLTLCLALLAPVSTVAVALAADLNYSVIVNGQVAPEQAIVVNGKTYVPLSAFKLLGVQTSLKGSTLTLGAQAAPATAPGGADQKASLEGCIHETLFNGVWRLTVNSVKPVARYNGQQKGYSLNLSWKNGTTKTIDALNTGVKAVTLVLQDGTTLTSENEQELKFRKLLIEIESSGSNSGVTFSSKTPSFRVKLDCQK